jgi:site-specific recombinase XerD
MNQAKRLPTIEEAIEHFRQELAARNRSPETLRAYLGDLRLFIEWLHENNVVAERVDQVERQDITEYLAHLGSRGISGLSRSRKLAAIREYFRFLADDLGILDRSPAEGIATPKKEKTPRTFLRPDEYSRMLSLAGAHPRDFCILTIFLQTGIRVSELCELRLDDIDIKGRALLVREGKGMSGRTIPLEKKAIQALTTWISARPDQLDDYLFLNRFGEPLVERGVRRIVVKYRELAGITRAASCHSLRHTCATFKAEKGVTAFQLQQLLGHKRLDTTQIYVHLGQQNLRKVMEATSL